MNQSQPEQLKAPVPVTCLQFPTSSHCKLHEPVPHVWSNESATLPLPVHVPLLPHSCEHEASCEHESVQSPVAHVSEQTALSSQVALQTSEPEHVNAQT